MPVDEQLQPRVLRHDGLHHMALCVCVCHVEGSGRFPSESGVFPGETVLEEEEKFQSEHEKPL